MDPERVHAYLQVACAGLGFDIGEVWWTSDENGSSSLAAIEEGPSEQHLPQQGDDRRSASSAAMRRYRFVQLYTSRSYESRRSELVNPPDDVSSSSNNNDVRRNGSSDNLQQHVLSPRLVDAISRTCQVVWATTKKQEGLIGRSDIRLQTAVGMPVAMDRHGNMCVVVMFSPNNVQSTDDAMEYLHSISQSATSSSIPCLLPVFDSPAVGVMKEILPSLTAPIHTVNPDPSPTSLGEGVTARFVSLDDAHSSMLGNRITSGSDDPERSSGHDLSEAPKDTFGIPMLPTFAELGQMTAGTEDLEAFDEATYGIWTTIMENNDDPLYQLVADADMTTPETKREEDVTQVYQLSSAVTTPLKESRKQRLVEFCDAFLGMSVFDLADVWAPSDANSPYPTDTLCHVVTVKSADSAGNPALAKFQQVSERTLIKFWNGAVGRAYATGNPVWSSNENNFIDSGRNGAFQQAHFRTVLAIPVFSKAATRPSCVVSAYACVKSESVPFVLRFVQQALRVLWDGLDRIDQPHVATNVWENVAPADLGEMAADVEMQQHFQARKRSHQVMASSTTEPTLAPASADASSILEKKLSSQLQSIELPNGDVISIPFHHVEEIDTASKQEVRAEDLQNHVNEALRSVAHAYPAPRASVAMFTPQFVSTSPSAPKKAHLGPAVQAVPLAMPQPLPSEIVAGSNAKSSIARQGLASSVPLNITGVTPLAAPMLNPITKTTPAPTAANHLVPEETKIPAPEPSPSAFLCIPINNNTTTVSFNMGIAPPPVGVKTCRIHGCEEVALARRPYCVRHSGNRQCEHVGCGKCAQGSTRFCIAHGGGRRCTFPGCDKGARDKKFCAAHGGGKRCQYIGGCNKSAVGGSSLCTSHGGGRRCDVPGCGKSAQSSTKFCVKHGGGKKCSQDGCEKVARGRTSYCAAHGGGVRCKLEGCNRVSIGKLQLCRAHGGGSSRGGGPSSHDVASVLAPAPAINVDNRMDTSQTT
ncbi:hypothetical protein ACA910_001386 [Epithemia clementina (nom. ined.)]